ncbi:hypothetical protein LCGC14_0378960 [marine sediment metagenome]|uniref:Uncharacterized protein n=1 Tax=marine sediment metagenome TaxID=412755 RepID=A0A0F9VQA7_9ZZZZ
MPTIAEYMAIVDKRETDRSALHNRQDGDLDRYFLAKYRGETNENGQNPLDNFKKFTSNDAATSLDLAAHLMGTAPVLIRVRKPKGKKQQQEIDNLKELAGIGWLSEADTRRAGLDMPSLQDALDGQSLLRGQTSQRVLLVKENIDTPPGSLGLEPGLEDLNVGPDGQTALATQPQIQRTRTFVDIQDWDPRNTYVFMGPNGKVAVCHKAMKTAEQILAEWGITLEDGTKNTDKEHATYEFFDEQIGWVSMKGRELKPETSHGMGTVPVDVHTVGWMPFFQAEGKDYEAHYGESFYHSVREIYDQQNFMLSILAEISSRSINQGLLVKSRDGSWTLDGDIRETGAELSVATGDDQDVVPMPPIEMVQASATFMGVVAGMAQRGTFPSSAFGELAFQLSGFAITQLRQGMEAPIGPPVKTVTLAFKGILNILGTAYATGNFDEMTLTGRMQDVGRTDFEEKIPIQVLQQGGNFDVEIVPQLPQDDANKVALANLYVQGDIPLADHRFVREKILMMQDVEQVERAVQEQLAKTGSPAALAFSNMLAAAEQENFELAEIWFTEWKLVMTERLIAVAQINAIAAQVGVQGPGTPSNGSGAGPDPRAVPQPLLGGGPPEPTPQAGSLQPAGATRPGALAGATDRGL